MLETTNTVHLLKSHGIKPSLQRVKIYNYLASHTNHPTIDMIFQELAPEIPTLSKTTVYNTLKLFHSVDVAQAITIDEHEVRYDANVMLHGHFKCMDCGQVFDFTIDQTTISHMVPEGFSVEEEHIYCKGICPECNRLAQKSC